MLLKNVLASKVDKKVTIMNGEMRKLIGKDYDNDEVTVYYYGKHEITFKSTRRGTTWYANKVLPSWIGMPKVKEPVFHEMSTMPASKNIKQKKVKKVRQPKLFIDEYFIDKNKPVSTDKFALIRDWAKQRGLYEKGDVKTQFLKLQEETGELAKAILKDDRNEIIDAIGDIVVVLTNLTQLTGIFVEVKGDTGKLRNITIEDCIDTAYNVIKLRTGSMKNGTFVKNER
jgi:hypothetical protein